MSYKKRHISDHLTTYVPTKATRIGIEPTTSAVTGRRSNQLSHRAIGQQIPDLLTRQV